MRPLNLMNLLEVFKNEIKEVENTNVSFVTFVKTAKDAVCF